MSTPNPTHTIAAGMREVATEGREGTPGTREDGQLWGAFPNTMTLTDLAAHVVSKLTDAGYSIVQLPATSTCRHCWEPIEHSDGRWRHTENGFGMLTCGSAYQDAGGNYYFAAPAAPEGEKP
ncbi:hypothetical protein HQO24_10385 [Rhodococcus fascians]|nr:hypothetical protein [Rhodococcus fascians]MBY4396912.1 hypothetical protein [Rhodococcus fascians]MBY4407391.1 hypothetical protein [Rhodococcus fascians]MBY4421480.1 hypothetical protein [Rhodococcus fascians]MBY4460767.1 hypothetical protein [Rhodococcus fascians]